MSRESGEQVVLVIMEQGSDWPSWVDECRTRTPDAIVIAQQYDELPAELALRVMRRLQGLEASGRTVATSVLAAGEGSDDETFEARCRVARALLTHMSSQGSSGGLVFAGRGAGDDEARHELMALAGTLMDQLTGTDLSIGLRFDHPAQEHSGVWARSTGIETESSAA